MVFKAIARIARPLVMFGAISIFSAFAAEARGTWEGAPKASSKAAAIAPNPALKSMALREASAKHARGQRVWCVPFARDASGVQLQGNAKTWWGKAEGLYGRGNKPRVGSVMTFQATGKLPQGHVAVVSKVVSPREIRIDHANWSRNKVSLGMRVVDVSPANNWSAVRLESVPNTLGMVYPVKGFIYP
ncbi:CHAP domain-containing protein [Paracoccus aminophilus]|uniref:Peptidase C51 domain-containing protein n=1 Tax=Paracoccus aminophilus JCM 7686 TaxID=1367847 RepID=S5XUA5_PARAH|nr:CHAP domain-containing protein [Paracoccus aminophilus]AGT11054.1 hypothetical protein JCM7686_pAMI4p370 [Paracoccus aminophilus JCM 7686]